MGWKPPGALGASVAYGAAWILPESYLAEEVARAIFLVPSQGNSPDLLGSFPSICHNQVIMAMVSLGTLLDSGEVGQRFFWASGAHRLKVQTEEGFCSGPVVYFCLYF